MVKVIVALIVCGLFIAAILQIDIDPKLTVEGKRRFWYTDPFDNDKRKYIDL